MQADDPRLAEAKRKRIDAVAADLKIDWMEKGYPERVGHCPKCGGREKPGSDRFSMNLRDNVFYCRKCDVGGDPIALVRFVLGCSFLEALDWLCGERQKKQETKAERAARLAKEEADEVERAKTAAAFRARSIAAARAIWRQGVAPEGTDVEAYLARRAIDFARLGGIPKVIRFHPALGYTVEEGGNQRRLIHRGPAMLCAIQGPDGRFSAVHRTWLDLSQPKGKAVITDPKTGALLESKKVLGSKKGGAIRLTHTRTSDVMIMGEGVETTASAWMGDPDSGAMYWAGVDLGNMAGRQERVPGTRHSGLPDLDDAEAFLPPPGVTRLVYVQDGDSEPKSTRAKLEAGLRRAMLARPGLRGQIAPAPDGKDLNDVLMGVG